MRKAMSNPADQPKIKDPMDDVEAQGHMRTLIDAHQVMQDPDKMKKVHALMGRHQKAVSSLKDLNDIYQKKYGGKPKAKSDEAAGD